MNLIEDIICILDLPKHDVYYGNALKVNPRIAKQISLSINNFPL